MPMVDSIEALQIQGAWILVSLPTGRYYWLQMSACIISRTYQEIQMIDSFSRYKTRLVVEAGRV